MTEQLEIQLNSDQNPNDSKLTQDQVNQRIWKVCGQFRGLMDAPNYKDYILIMLFLKYVSDVWNERYQQLMDEYGDEPELVDEMIQQERFIIPKRYNFWTLYENRALPGLGERIDKALHAIEAANPRLQDVFQDTSFNTNKLGNEQEKQDLLSGLLQTFANEKINLSPSRIGGEDVIGNAYEYLIKEFAAGAGKKAGEFYTPPEVSSLLARLVQPNEGDRICDPTCGSGSLLMKVAKEVRNNGGSNYELFGQEKNRGTWALCKMNLFLHREENHLVEQGDTLRNPLIKDDQGRLLRFDRVVANPPFSLENWGRAAAESDEYGRFTYGLPPKDVGDFAFIQHMVATLSANGRMGSVVPHGILFRGGQEGKIRQGMLEDDLVEAVIGLPPALFYGAGISTALLLINKQKPVERQNKVLFINAELEFEEGKNQNRLRESDLQKIFDTFINFQETPRYSKVATSEEIKSNDYNLNIRLYADTSPPPENFDVRAILYGGVPVSEVEDEYIQETLQGLDVGGVFVRRDDHYYDFRKEVETKEQINEFLESSDPKVVAVFERWWDKYRISLNQLDAELNSAEKVMQRYFKELGYE